ncbi:mitochondrial carrier protein [Trypanosoma rangeli]|uniref:Mitochondrial carrier protein n=1 Tax=Trypanosoma rangeli TaxID=5698 RepID=A0A3R7RT89_TRYRA|nr:mitochondrial carrier protein [Trypanosoma rangeli]RNF12426.1 mitochondrial carrier protein [Trypanosoma rangeli]|eukprot:RNF12426.1 mitochondrial carrier protein [Trypanosoma rangeli]
MDLLNSFISGWVGGVGLLLVGHPFDTVKTLLQDSKGKHESGLSCAVGIVKKDGPFALYKGVMAPMTGVGVVFALYFLAYDATEKLIRSVKELDPSKPLSLCDVIICGGSTGILGSLVLGPAELLKIRQQTALNTGADSSLRGVVSFIYRTAGPRGFFRGTSMTMLRDVPGSMAWFGAYEYTKLLICSSPKAPSVPESLIAGGIAGISMWSFAVPLDVIKTRVQASRERLTLAGAVRGVFKERGIRGFYRGLGPALLRAFPANAACFAAKDFTQKALNRLPVSAAPTKKSTDQP